MDQHNNERICVIYFEDQYGHVLVAPDYLHPTPKGYERREARTLRDVDKLTHRLNTQDNAMFQRMWAQEKAVMIERHKVHKRNLAARLDQATPAEKMFILSAFAYFDRKEKEYDHYRVRGFFHQREFDSPGNDPIDANVHGGKQLVMPKMSDRLAAALGIPKP